MISRSRHTGRDLNSHDDADPGGGEQGDQLAAGVVACERGDEGNLPAVAGGEDRGQAGATGTGPLHQAADDGDRRVGGQPFDPADEVPVEEGVTDDD